MIDLLPDIEAWNIVGLMSHPGCYLPFDRPTNITFQLKYNQQKSSQIYLEALTAPLSIAEHPTSSSTPSSNFLKPNQIVANLYFGMTTHM